MSTQPLMSAQLAAWLDRLPVFELGGVAPLWYVEVDLTDLDLDRYTAAWQRLVDTHPELRTVLTDDGAQQTLADPPQFDLTVEDLRSFTDDQRAEHLATLRTELLGADWDPRHWPPFTVRAAALDGRRTRVFVAVDQFVADHAGMSRLGLDLADAYRQPTDAAVTPGVSPAAVAGPAGDASAVTAGESRKYWRQRLAELPPAPQAPMVSDPHLLTRPAYSRRAQFLSESQWQQLQHHAGQAGLTPGAVLTAAFGEALASWSKESRFTILTIEADAGSGRSPIHLTELNNDPVLTFRQRASALQEQIVRDRSHDQVDGVDLLDELRRTTGQPVDAVIPVMLGLHLRPTETPARDGSPWTLGSGEVHFELAQQPRTWLRHDATDATGPLRLTYETVDDLFPPGLLDDLVRYHLQLLHRLADGSGWDQPAGGCLRSAQEAVRNRVNDTAVPMPDALLHEGFWAQAGRTPDAPAVIATDQVLTFRQLRNSAGLLGHRLTAAGVGRGDLVAVVMEKGWQQPLAVLGVLDAGAAYVPIEPDVPTERLHYLLGHCGARVALVQPHLLESLPWPDAVTPIVIDAPVLDAAAEQPHPRRIQQPSDLAYIIYTSGSTGLPKGVMISHRSAWNTVSDINHRFAVTADDRMLALTPLSFDLSVYDLFGPFAVGGSLVIPDAGTGRAPWHWAELLTDHRVTLWNTVPALMEMLVGYVAGRREQLPDTLRLVMMSGDWIPVSLPARIRALTAPDIDLISLGGATEASVWSIWHRISDVQSGWVSIPYGTPLANQQFEILDEALRRRPDWVPGQQYIAGAGVAMGYWHDEERTARSFITHPHTGQRLYRTGDLGRYFPDGSIEFLGRDDFQVKIHGYRIELGEIEATLLSHDQVRAAVVIAIGKARGEKRLVAYITANEPATVEGGSGPGLGADAELLVKTVREYLVGKLPAHMVPSHMVVLDALPLTGNGKVDRNALPSPVAPRAAPAPVDPDPVEQQILAIWRDVLGTDEVAADDDWCRLDASPAQVVRAHHRLRTSVAPSLALEDMFRHRSVRSLATVLRKQPT